MLRKSVSILMCCLILTFCICSYATEDISEPILPYGESGWISIPITDFIRQAEEGGYSRTETTLKGFEKYVTYEKADSSIYKILAMPDEKTFNTSTVVMFCEAGLDVRNTIDALSGKYGAGDTASVLGLPGTARYWEGEQYLYFIVYDGGYDEVLTGQLSYVFMIVEQLPSSAPSTETSFESPVSEPEPEPTPQVRSNIVVTNATLTRNSAGTDEAYITLKNKLKVSVDRVDFYVKCYDAYGNLIKGYNHYDVSSCFYDEIIKPGESTDKDIYWGLYGFTGTKSIEVAIVSYHTITGETIEIPADSRLRRSSKT